MKTLTLRLKSGATRIAVGKGIFPSLRELFPEISEYDSIFLVADEMPLGSRGAEIASVFPDSSRVFAVRGGELIKAFDLITFLYKKFLSVGLTRKSAIFSLGGGTVSDAVGFAAATYLRGVAHYIIPTTLLSMADASVGGKTGINIPEGKNLVGAFHHPRGVLSDVNMLSTLEKREIASGAAEILKCAFIADEKFLGFLESRAMEILNAAPNASEKAVYNAVKIKAAFVKKDERDAGARMALNFGHTFGHAFEAALGYAEISHGEAVAAGMVSETLLAERMGICGPDVRAQIESALGKFELPARFPKADLDAVLAAMEKDKKASGGVLRFALPVRIGEVKIIEQPDLPIVSEIIGQSMI